MKERQIVYAHIWRSLGLHGDYVTPGSKRLNTEAGPPHADRGVPDVPSYRPKERQHRIYAHLALFQSGSFHFAPGPLPLTTPSFFFARSSVRSCTPFFFIAAMTSRALAGPAVR